MKKILQEELSNQLQAQIRGQIDFVTRLKSEDPDKLLRQPAPGKWSAVQVLEHLNSYGHFYIPEIDKAIRNASATRGFYKPGWLGDYFVKLIQLDEKGQPKKKMKAIKRHQPQFHADSKPVIQSYLQQQQQLLQLISYAREKDWGSSRTRVSISKIITMKLGDCLRFVVAHQERHLAQVRGEGQFGNL